MPGADGSIDRPEDRTLTTVMFTDMVGYSELTQRDEAGALRLVNEHRRIVRPLLADHGGREVKTIGDAFMVEFNDPISSVRCALEIQRRHAERNRDPTVPEMNIRIGIHMGPVFRQDGDLFGDTVNVASRIEPLAPPGGICLSEPAYRAALATIDAVAVPVGPATLKNIHLPVAIYRIDPSSTRHPTLREGPWVGREEEFGRLRSGLDAARAGAPQILLLAGEPGVGKTRIVEQLIRWASRQEMDTYSSKASEEGVATPYALWVQAIEAIALAVSPDRLQTAAGPYARELLRLVPELPIAPGPATEASVSEPDRAQEQLFSGVAHFLAELARGRPTLLFFDDVHSADTGSLRLLESVARHLGDSRLLVIAAFRPDPPGSPSVLAGVRSSLASQPGVSSLALANLPLPAVRQLVVATAKSKAISDTVVQQIFDRTGGNPYFVEEVVRSLQERGLFGPDGAVLAGSDSLPIPDSVRRLVRRRIEGADDSLVTFLRTVSVLGPEFGAPLAERVVGAPPASLLDSLGAAVQAGFLKERMDDQGVARYAFSDRLLWETVYSDSPGPRRNRDHLRAGEALESLQRGGQRIPAAEIAYHFQRAQAPGRALGPTIQAAEEAGRLYAREEAVRHYRTALSLLEARPDERTRARLQEALGDHLYRIGQLEAGQAARSEAAAIYERLGASQEAGDLHRRIAHGMREDPAAARTHWEEALRLLQDVPESREMARVLATIAGYRYEDGDLAAAGELYGRAADAARRVNDPLTQVSAQIILAGLRPVREADRIFQDLEEALAIADAEKLEALTANVCMVLALAHLHVDGDGAAARRSLDRALEAARQARDRHTEQTVEGNLETYTSWRAGDYDRALRTAEAHLAYAAGDPRRLLPTALLVAADIALSRGEGDRAQHDLEEVAALLEGGGDWSERVHLRNVRGRAELLRGRLARAAGPLREAHELALAAGAPALMAVLHAETLHAEVELAIRTGELGPAGVLVAALERLDAERELPPVRAFAARARALVLAAGGAEPGGAIGAMEQAVGLWERIGWGYELAKTRVWLADLYRRAGEEAQAEATEAPARAFLDRVGDVTVRSKATTSRPAGASAGATGRSLPGPPPPRNL